MNNKIACSLTIYEKIRDEATISGPTTKAVKGMFPGARVFSVEGMPDNEWLLVPCGMDLDKFETCIKDFGYEKAKNIFHMINGQD